MSKIVLDEKPERDMMRKVRAPVCGECKHLGRSGQDCVAFPDEIPDAILLYGFDHRKPYKGDSGIRFEPVEGK